MKSEKDINYNRYISIYDSVVRRAEIVGGKFVVLSRNC